MKVVLLPICLVACIAICFGQSNKPGKPDLSGSWELDPARNQIAKSDTTTPQQVKITHHDPELIVRRRIVIKGVAEERDLTYYTDGRGERNPLTAGLRAGAEAGSTTTWSKDKIVTRALYQTSTEAGTAELQVIDEWQLSSNGETLIHTNRIVSKVIIGDQAPNIARGADFKTIYKLISK